MSLLESFCKRNWIAGWLQTEQNMKVEEVWDLDNPELDQKAGGVIEDEPIRAMLNIV